MEKTHILPLDLQFFAEEEGSDETVDTQSKSTTPPEEKITFTPEQQAHVDYLVATAKSKAKSAAKKDYEASVAEQVKAAIQKEKNYSKLSDDDRKRQEFEDERVKFEEEKANFEKERLINEVSKDLMSKGLPAEFASFLAVPGDSEQSLENVKSFKDQFDQAVADQVMASLRQKEPTIGGSGNQAMSYGKTLAQ
ncbi:MAG: DUF4355 domain-containing protein [Aerococcus sp.]|nr:DUF4355 domain-containing protein [Aerococcus sp.]